MKNIWQPTHQFRRYSVEDKAPVYKFMGDVSSYISGIYYFTGQDYPEVIEEELQIRIKAKPLNLYGFHSNPSELVGYKDGASDKLTNTTLHQMHDSGRTYGFFYEEIFEGGIWDTIEESMKNQFGKTNLNDSLEIRPGEEGEIIIYTFLDR